MMNADMKRSATLAAMAKKQDVKLTADHRMVVIYGPEMMLQKQRLDELKAALTQVHGELDPILFDGAKVELAQVLDELRTFGLLQSYKLVIVEDAGDFVTRHREALERYADDPVDSATFVLRGGTWRSTDKLYRKAQKVGAVVKCEPLSGPKAVAWLLDQAGARHQVKLNRDAAQALVDRLGTDLLRLDSELGKLSLLVDAGQAIEPWLVQQTVGRSSDEEAYVVQEAVLQALLTRTGGKSNVIKKVHELIDLSRQPEVRVMYFITDLVRKLHIASGMREGGASPGQISKAMRLWGERQKMFMTLLNRLDVEKSGRLFDRAVRADARSKSGFGNVLSNIETFCAVLSDSTV